MTREHDKIADRTHDHETLSALFDDALDADAARFALRRLGHDRDWQARLSRWQIAGDVLRGERVLPLSDGFTARVSAAVQAETCSHAAVAARAPMRRWPWLGGAALAASVAVVALLAWPDAPAPLPSTPAAGVAASANPTPAAVIGSRHAEPVSITAPTAVTATVASAAPLARGRVRTVPARDTAPAVAATNAPSAVASVTPAVLGGDAADPFGLQGRAIPTRPWPRDRFGLDSHGNGLTAAYEFSEAAPARDDPFRTAGKRADSALGHGAHPQHTDAPPQPLPVTHDAPP